MLGSVRPNQHWLTARKGFTDSVAAQFARFNADSAQRQRQFIERRDFSNRQVQGRRIDVLGGTVSLVDPVSGEHTTVRNTSLCYFRVDPDPSTGDPSIVGSDIARNPAPLELRQMLRVGIDVPYP